VVRTTPCPVLTVRESESLRRAAAGGAVPATVSAHSEGGRTT
jgi:hypothetical protein